LLNDLPEAVVFLQLLAGLLDSGSGWNDALHGFARHRMGQRVRRAMALRPFLAQRQAGLPHLRKRATKRATKKPGRISPICDSRNFNWSRCSCKATNPPQSSNHGGGNQYAC